MEHTGKTGLAGFSEFFSNSLAMMLLIDPETHQIVDANKAAEQFYGWSKPQLTSMKIEDINTLSLEEINIEIKRARSQQRSYFCFRHRKANNTIVPVEVFSSRVVLNGKDYLHSIVYDCIEKENAKERVSQNEYFLRLFVEHAPAAIAMFDTEMKYIIASKRYIDDYRLNGQELAGHSHYEIFPEIGERWKAIHHRCLSGETLKEESDPFPRPDGAIDWVRWEIIPWLQPDGKVGGIILFSEVITKEVNATLFIKENEERYRYLFEKNPLPMWIFDIHSLMFLEVNNAAIEQYGFTREEFLSMTINDIRPSDNQARLKEHLNQTRHSLNKAGIWRHYTKNKEIIYVEIISHLIDFGGKKARMVLSNNVSKRVEAENKLNHSHNLMRYIIEHNSSAVAVHDKNLNYVYVSQSYLKQYEVKEKDIIGKNHYDVFPDLPQKWRNVHQRALKGEVLNADDDIYFRSDGTQFCTRWECRPWYESEGKIGGIVIYTEVINERKERELEIKQFNSRLEKLVQALQELTVAQTVEDVQRIVVQSARKLIGADGAAVVFREKDQCYYVAEDAIAPLWKGKHFPINSCVSGWVIQSKQAAIIPDIYADKRVPHEDYRPTFVKSLAMVPININGAIGAIGNYWNHHYKASEIEVDLLQTLADSASRALENIQLMNQIEQKAVEHTRRLEAAFLANMSHEIRTPINSIMGFSSLLPEEDNKELIDMYAGQIVRNSEHLVNIIDGIVLYSRLQANMLEYNPLEFNIFDMLMQIKQSYCPPCEKLGIEFRIVFSKKNNPLIKTDYEKLKMVFNNLLANSFKYTLSGEIQIGAKTNRKNIEFYISDTGIGIPKHEIPRVFDRFFRGSNTRKETVPGTGLGLPIVTEIIKILNGKIWIESEEGKGCTVFFSLPKNKK